MPEYRRFYQPGGQYFLTVVTYERRPLLTGPLARQLLREAWKTTAARFPFRVEALCLMPDHIHCIWTLPENDADFSVRWNQIKSQFSKAYMGATEQPDSIRGNRSTSRKRRGEATIWQRRFWEHLIRDEHDFARHVDYIHYNPVKHGLVEWAGEWRWSSFHRYLSEGLYDREWGWVPPPSLSDFDESCEP